MSKLLDLASKGIQKGFQAIEEHDIEKGRRWREQQEREEEKRERKREYLRSVYAMNPEELRRYGLDPNNMTDEQLDEWGNNDYETQTSFNMSDEEISYIIDQHYQQELFRAEQIAEEISEYSMNIPDSAILQYIENAQAIINSPKTVLDQYPNLFESEFLYNSCLKELGRSRAENWGTYDFKKLKNIIINAWKKRLDNLIAYAISRKAYLNPVHQDRLSMYEQKYEERQRLKKEENERKRKKQEEEKKKKEKEEAERRKQEAIIAHKMKYHKLVACAFLIAWLVAFIFIFSEMEEWYEYVLTSVVCLCTGLALFLYTFSIQIVHRNISLVLWISWAILMFYTTYDTEWWSYLLAIVIGGIATAPLYFYQMEYGDLRL